MALIQCPECGKSISEYASCCPNCGCPSSKFLSNGTKIDEAIKPDEPKTKSNRKKSRFKVAAIVCIVLVVLGGITFGAYKLSHPYADDSVDYVTKGLADAIQGCDSIGNFQYGVACIYKGGKCGVIDKLGNEILPCQYDEVSTSDYSKPDSTGIFMVKKDDKWGVVDVHNKFIVECKYDELYIDSTTIRICNNDKYGLLDLKGDTLAQLIYNDMDWNFSDNLCWVQKDSLYGFIDRTGKEVIPCVYENTSSFSEGLCAVRTNDMWGYIDTTGKVIIPFSESLSGNYFEDGKSTMTRWSETQPGMIQSAWIDKTGKQISDYFDGAVRESMHVGHFYVVTTDYSDDIQEEALIDTDGNCIFPFGKYYYCFFAYSDNSIGLCNRKEYFNIDSIESTLQKTSYILNVKDKNIIPANNSNICYDAGDSKNICVEQNGKYGCLDKHLQIVVPLKYDEPIDFFSDMAAVKKNGKYGYIDRNNKLIIPFKYDDAWGMSDGFVVVKKNGKYGYVDKYGNDTFSFNN